MGVKMHAKDTTTTQWKSKKTWNNCVTKPDIWSNRSNHWTQKQKSANYRGNLHHFLKYLPARSVFRPWQNHQYPSISRRSTHPSMGKGFRTSLVLLHLTIPLQNTFVTVRDQAHTLPWWTQRTSTIHASIYKQLNCSDKGDCSFQKISFISLVQRLYSLQLYSFLIHISNNCHCYCYAEAWRNGCSLPKVFGTQTAWQGFKGWGQRRSLQLLALSSHTW